MDHHHHAMPLLQALLTIKSRGAVNVTYHPEDRSGGHKPIDRAIGEEQDDCARIAEGGPSVVPSDHDPVWFIVDGLDVRNEEDGHVLYRGIEGRAE